MIIPSKEDMGAEETDVARESDSNRKISSGNFVTTVDFRVPDTMIPRHE